MRGIGHYGLRCTAFAAAVCLASTAVAQSGPVGGVARSSVGQVGQRQVREQATGGLEPLVRINSRVQNRVQSRIRNRIDRYYDPRANAQTPFDVAADQARVAGRNGRR